MAERGGRAAGVEGRGGAGASRVFRGGEGVDCGGEVRQIGVCRFGRRRR